MSESTGLVAMAVTVLVIPSYRTEAVAASVEYSMSVLGERESEREKERETEKKREREGEREREKERERGRER